MGTNNLATKNAGDVISQDDPNQYKTSLGEDLVPRNTSGVPTTNAGNLGTSTYAWKKAEITTGYWTCGDVKMFHDFNGAVSPGQGWMKCNGDTVTEANYDAIHGAGSWSTYIGSSPLDGKNLPAMDNKVPVGKDTTPQDGSSAITYEGNSSHQVNTSHRHLVIDDLASGSHLIQWSTTTSANGEKYFGASGGGKNVDSLGSEDIYTNDGGSAALNIKPHSAAFQFWIRII